MAPYKHYAASEIEEMLEEAERAAEECRKELTRRGAGLIQDYLKTRHNAVGVAVAPALDSSRIT
jgi:hypothetical protein